MTKTTEAPESAKPQTPTPLAVYRTKLPKEATFEQVASALAAANEVVTAAEFGSGFDILDTKEKQRLVGVPFIILDWSFNEGDNGEFVSLRIVTKANEHLIVNDGSTGILRQMQEIGQLGEDRAIFVKKGLRVSNYEYTDKETGAKKPASTYYLDTSA